MNCERSCPNGQPIVHIPKCPSQYTFIRLQITESNSNHELCMYRPLIQIMGPFQKRVFLLLLALVMTAAWARAAADPLPPGGLLLLLRALPNSVDGPSPAGGGHLITEVAAATFCCLDCYPGSLNLTE